MAGPNTFTIPATIGATKSANLSGLEIAQLFGSTSAKMTTSTVISAVA